MPQPQHFVEQMASQLRGQLQDDAQKLGAGILGSTQPDGHRVPREKMLAFVRASWTDPKFRMGLLQQFGPKQFLQIANAAMAPAIEAWSQHEAQMQDGRLAQIASGQMPQGPGVMAPPGLTPPPPPPTGPWSPGTPPPPGMDLGGKVWLPPSRAPDGGRPVASGTWAPPGMGG